MINYGKITEYNGSSGLIIDKEGNKYILLSQNILYENAKIDDYVSFIVETYKTVEIEEKVATFVKKVK